MYTIYGKAECGYCKRAKDLLDILGEDYEYLDIGNVEIHEAMNTRLGYEARTVPQIWENDTHIGGFTELSAHTK